MDGWSEQICELTKHLPYETMVWLDSAMERNATASEIHFALNYKSDHLLAMEDIRALQKFWRSVHGRVTFIVSMLLNVCVILCRQPTSILRRKFAKRLETI